MNETYSVGISGVVVGMTKSTALTQDGVPVITTGINIGLGSPGIGISTTKGTTTQTGGAKEIDPNSEKYYSWSPYVYCYNNPLIYVDPTGVLNSPQATHGQGYTAILIGSEQKGWTYISKDGAQDKWYSNYATGGPSKVGEGYFKTIADFNKSDFAKEYDGFTDRVRFSSDDQQDK